MYTIKLVTLDNYSHNTNLFGCIKYQPPSTAFIVCLIYSYITLVYLYLVITIFVVCISVFIHFIFLIRITTLVCQSKLFVVFFYDLSLVCTKKLSKPFSQKNKIIKLKITNNIGVYLKMYKKVDISITSPLLLYTKEGQI